MSKVISLCQRRLASRWCRAQQV